MGRHSLIEHQPPRGIQVRDRRVLAQQRQRRRYRIVALSWLFAGLGLSAAMSLQVTVDPAVLPAAMVTAEVTEAPSKIVLPAAHSVEVSQCR